FFRYLLLQEVPVWLVTQGANAALAGYGSMVLNGPLFQLAHVAVLDEHGLPVPDGEPGRLAYTHLDRAGTVLLRFLVGDRAVLDQARIDPRLTPEQQAMNAMGSAHYVENAKAHKAAVDAAG
ncbi:hypothetical protein, partial [uncultured Parasphingopyxis sp.]|uniref:hypothetical protein n=1 Tax=uncultured Parasphingopyxis sp. TaxID=1547918 RepID=UPI002627F393